MLGILAHCWLVPPTNLYRSNKKDYRSMARFIYGYRVRWPCIAPRSRRPDLRSCSWSNSQVHTLQPRVTTRIIWLQ